MSHSSIETVGGSGLSHGERVMTRLEQLARFSTEPGALTRLYLSPAHKEACRQVRAWMEAAGMTSRIDAVGNVVGRYEGRTPSAPALLLGSHIDTVRNGGKYDGSFGVVAAIEAVSCLKNAGERMAIAIEVLAFGDEEGVRFPVALTSSRAVAGTLDPATLDAKDSEEISIREALRRFGCSADEIPSAARRTADVLGYIELHIEQGPVLEAEGLPLGVVTAIAGASRATAEITGMAGHAGTVPMALRRDALAAAAEMLLAVEEIARSMQDVVATAGWIEAMPGAVNVIPGGARFSLDVRSPRDAVRNEATARIEEAFRTIAARRNVGVRLVRSYEEAAATCAPWLVEQLATALGRSGIRPRNLPSGAGHDGLAMAALCPIGMLFVRCKGGISHHPAEAVTAADAGIAITVLVDFLRHFVPSLGLTAALETPAP
ncbi:MAG: allantoate amidohydrolase [Acetobacteraceae bacterium]